ncbi:hypothetical protein LINPERHAP1_LOCUS7552 [Linum perenne]
MDVESSNGMVNKAYHQQPHATSRGFQLQTAVSLQLTQPEPIKLGLQLQ